MMKYVVNSKEPKSESEDDKAPLLPSCRFTLALMTFLALTVLGLLRSNLTITLVCMVRKKQPLSLPNGTTTMDLNFTAEETTVASNWSMSSQLPSDEYKGEFLWTRQYQGFLLSAYFYGYLTTQLLGGFLAGKFGAKHVTVATTLVAAVATLLTPIAARFNPYLLVVLRAIVGCGTGFIFPAIQTLWGIWAPPLERSFLSSLTFVGLNVGYMLAFLISSGCCQIPYDNGWPFSFYITGGAAVLFCALWKLLVFNSPDQHPRISNRELHYIKSTTELKSVTSKERKPFPWMKATKSPAVIALLIVQTSHTWFSYTQTTSIPLYFRDVLKFDIKQNGLFMILPYLLGLLTSPPLACVADLLRTKKILSTTAVRKIFQSISSFGSVILIVIISFLDYDDRYVAVSLLIAMSVVMNTCRSGFLVNPQDIAPRYSGEIFGIVNTVATLSGILAPLAVGQLTSNGTVSEWRAIFYIAAAAFFVGGLVFAIFAKGEPLPWTKDNDVKMTVVVAGNDLAASSVACAVGDEDPRLNASAISMTRCAANSPTSDKGQQQKLIAQQQQQQQEQQQEEHKQQQQEEGRDKDLTEKF